VYLLKITNDWCKIGRSDSLDQRLKWWKSHGLEVIWRQETSSCESHWLEYAVNRSSLKPTLKQIKVFQRENPLFPNNRHSLPSGCTEWICMGAEQAIAVAEDHWLTVQHLSAHVPRRAGAKFHGMYWLRSQIPPADSMANPQPVYKGPVPLLITVPQGT